MMYAPIVWNYFNIELVSTNFLVLNSYYYKEELVNCKINAILKLM